MAENFDENIHYSFTGDSESLQAATSSAIQQLDAYSAAIKRAVAANQQLLSSTKSLSTNVSKSSGSSGGSGSSGKTGYDFPGAIDVDWKPVGDATSVASKDIAGKMAGLIGKLGTMMAILQVALKVQRVMDDNIKSQLGRVKKLAGAVASETKQFVSSLAQIGKGALSAAGGVVDFAQRSFSSIKKLGEGFRTVTTAGSKFFGFIKAAAGVQLGKSLAEAVQESIDYIENMNLLNVVLGENIQEGRSFIDTMSEMYGLDASSITKSVGYFDALSSAIGLSSNASYLMSANLTKTANDLASLFNVDIETAQENLASGMQGMSRSVRKYGMDIRVATLQETASTLGISKKVSKMSEANRMGLRYITMMRQASQASSDFANTIEQPANQLRIFKEQSAQLARAIGNLFLPMLEAVLPVLNGIMMALRLIITFVGSLMGIKIESVNTGIGNSASGAADSLEGEAGAIDSVGDSAAKTAKKLKDLIAPFDELNILQDQADSAGKSSGAGGGAGVGYGELDPAIAKALEGMSVKFENVRMKALDTRDAILKFFGLEVKDGKIVASVNGAVDRIIKAWNRADYKAVGAEFANLFNRGIDFGTKNLDWGDISSKLNSTVQKIVLILNGFIGRIKWEELGSLIATGFNTVTVGLRTAVDTFDWATLGASVASFVNGLFLNISWEKAIGAITTGILGVETAIGSAIRNIKWLDISTVVTNSLNTIVQAGVKFIDNLDWKTFSVNAGMLVSKFITDIDWVGATDLVFKALTTARDSINVFLQSMNWTAIEETLGVIVNNFFAKTRQFISEIDWKKMGTDIASFVNNTLATIDWEAVGTTIHDIIGGALDLALSFFKEADWDKIMDDIHAFMKGLDWGDLFNKLAKLWIDIFILKLRLKWSFVTSAIGELMWGSADEFSSKASPGKIDAAAAAGSKVTHKKPGGGVRGFATGAVVTGPTLAVVGEGKFDEAIMPLGNSPQMRDFVDKVADAASGNSGGDTVVHVYIGGEEFDAYTYKAVERGKKKVGEQPVKEGE